MKLSLVVLTPGPNQGKMLEIKLSQFLVGRDTQCHLRPASPMISKRHCAVLQREGKVFVRDFDSTNGTFVNNEQIKGEIELNNGDQLKIGPLSFTVLIEASTPVNRPTPPPPTKPATKTVPAVKAGTPVPATNSKPAAKPAPKSKPAPQSEAPAEPAASPPPEEEESVAAAATDAPQAEESASSSPDDDIAAMLLSLHDDATDGPSGSPPEVEVPEGSTVHELPVPPDVAAEMAKNQKEKEKTKTAAPGNTSLAAKTILEKYMKRPRG